MSNALMWQWLLVIASGLVFFWIAPRSRTVAQFFSALSTAGKKPGLLLLTSSLVISWIFAKSITNAANLGESFGMVGGVAYAVYYLSFLVAGIVIYRIRTKGGFKSIHHYLEARFGKIAVLIFSVLIGFRLFNEVWSNTMVIGSYYGDAGSAGYYWSIIIFTVLTLAYTMKGGLRSSLLTDAIQMVLFGVLLVVLLGFILPAGEHTFEAYVTSGSWEMAAGMNLMFVAFIQIFSYPFHDSVMTDRGFIGDPKTTLKSFLLAAPIGVLCLVLFSFVGIHAQLEGLEGVAAVSVSKTLGIAGMLAMNYIMVTSAASTLDSAFSSFSKLMVVDLGTPEKRSVFRGRIMMVILALAGTLPIFLQPEVLSATTVSGTMVIGLAPVFLLWNLKAPPASFMLAVLGGVTVGVLQVVKAIPADWILFEGKYGDLLTANIYGTVLCFALYILPIVITPRRNETYA